MKNLLLFNCQEALFFRNLLLNYGISMNFPKAAELLNPSACQEMFQIPAGFPADLELREICFIRSIAEKMAVCKDEIRISAIFSETTRNRSACPNCYNYSETFFYD